jgi:hypothetical protein
MVLYNTTHAIMTAKLAGWVTLYAVALIFIGLRLFSRIHIFGSLSVDDWLMVGAGVAYTGSMVSEVFIWRAFIDFAIVDYIKVHLYCTLLIQGCFCFFFHHCDDHVVDQILSMVFHETNDARKMDESGCECCIRDSRIELYRHKCL